MTKKLLKKVTEKKFDSGEIIESEEPLEKKITESEDRIDNQKFMEFLSISTEPIETLASKKPRNPKPIEQDEDVLSMNIQEEDKKEKTKKKDYFARTSKDYNLISPREEKKQDISTKSFQPQRIDFHETGRDTRMQLREVFAPNNEMTRLASQRRDEEGEKDYNIERVDFTEVGREKRYKLMK